MPKILNVVCVYFSIPFFFGDQLSYFTKKDYEIHLSCSPSEKLAPFAEKHGCKSTQIRIDRKFSVLSDLKAVWRLFRYMRRERFDIVSGHTPKGGLLSMIAAFFAGVPKRVFFRHGLVYETSSGLKRFILVNAERAASLFATQVVCVSPYLVERSVADRLTRRSKMMLLNIGSCNGVDALGAFDPDRIDPEKREEFRQRLLIPRDAFVIGYTGRLVRDKGIVELVDAFLEVNRENPQTRLLLVGPLEERDPLPEETVRMIREHPHIVYTGLVESDMPYYYAQMDLLVLCTHREGFGTSILEASSMRIPVLTTSHTGSRDAIVPGKTGVYVETTAESLCRAIREYMDNPALLRSHGEEGRRFVLENFEQRLIWREIETKIYQA